MDIFLQEVMGNACSELLNAGSPEAALKKIASKLDDVSTLKKEDIYVLSAILGTMFHQDYCDGRKLDKPLPDGRVNNPREKVLNTPDDELFVQQVREGRIPQSETLHFDENGRLIQDIANTQFVFLSPHWQDENFNAGLAASQLVISFWKKIEQCKSEEELNELLENIAAAIHVSWIMRKNLYKDVDQKGQVLYTNEELGEQYSMLPKDEQKKDRDHVDMARDLVERLIKFKEQIRGNKNSKGEVPPPDGPAF